MSSKLVTKSFSSCSNLTIVALLNFSLGTAFVEPMVEKCSDNFKNQARVAVNKCYYNRVCICSVRGMNMA